MRRVVLIRAEGVLVRESFTGPAIPEGLMILRWLLADPMHEPIVVTQDEEAARRWLLHEIGADEQLKVWAVGDPVKYARYLGYDVAMYVDHRPSLVIDAIQAGVVGVLVAAPAYMRPEFDPATRSGLRAWSEIEQEISQQELKRSATAARLEAEPDDGFEEP